MIVRSNDGLPESIGHVRISKSKQLSSEQKQEILDLWNEEYPANLQYNDISELDEYLKKFEDQNHMLLIDENDRVKGWYADFLRDDERWFLAILHSEIQGRRFGTQLIEMAKKANEELNGWVIKEEIYLKRNGEMYRSPIEFYRKNGFEIFDQIQLKTEKVNAIKIRWSKRNTKLI